MRTPTLRSNNPVVLTIVANPVLSYMARERALEGKTSFAFILAAPWSSSTSNNMIADLLAKAVVESKFHFRRAALDRSWAVVCL